MNFRAPILTTTAVALATMTSCTGQLPGSFRLQQQTQTFSSQLKINTQIDLLWVVDNSSSMDVSQKKLRDGFSSFAAKYMQPTWDIHVAVITTDTYLANPAFAGYLNTTLSGSVGWKSPYIASRLSTFRNPSWNPSLVNLNTGAFDAGVKYKEMIPAWGPNYAKLSAGIHDGPIAALCFEGMPYFLRAMSQCATRDDQTKNTGVSHCLTPSPGETSVTQCLNTVENDTVHSGNPIISTMPPAGTPGDAAWTAKLNQNFLVNLTTGSAGMGSERGLGSVIQFFSDNEVGTTAFFRAGSLRALIFISDEDDQTMPVPSAPSTTYSPWTHYACDQASLTTMNGAAAVSGSNGFCCSSLSNNCLYGSEGTSCSPKTVDGLTYTLSVCPLTSQLTPVSTIKSQIDQFFLNLDGASGTNPNYFVVSIVPQTGASIQSLQAARDADDQSAVSLKIVAVDRGDRYIELGNEVSNGSLVLDIASSDYSPILTQIGQTILQKKGSFTLDRAPTSSEDMIVTLIHADGSTSVIPSTSFTISGKTLTISDLNLVLSFKSTDQVSINYQPKTVF